MKQVWDILQSKAEDKEDTVKVIPDEEKKTCCRVTKWQKVCLCEPELRRKKCYLKGKWRMKDNRGKNHDNLNY